MYTGTVKHVTDLYDYLPVTGNEDEGIDLTECNNYDIVKWIDIGVRKDKKYTTIKYRKKEDNVSYLHREKCLLKVFK